MADNSTTKPTEAKTEERREAVSTTMSDKVQDGRGVNTTTGGLKTGADQVTFTGTMTRLDSDGYMILTDRLVRDQKLSFTPNTDNTNTFQW